MDTRRKGSETGHRTMEMYLMVQNCTPTMVEMVNFMLYVFYHHILFLFYFFGFFQDAPTAYGGSQARGEIGAIAAGLCHSHSKSGSKALLKPTPQLIAKLDP